MKDKEISAKEIVDVLNDELKNFKDTVQHSEKFKQMVEEVTDDLSKQIFDGVTGRLGIEV